MAYLCDYEPFMAEFWLNCIFSLSSLLLLEYIFYSTCHLISFSGKWISVLHLFNLFAHISPTLYFDTTSYSGKWISVLNVFNLFAHLLPTIYFDTYIQNQPDVLVTIPPPSEKKSMFDIVQIHEHASFSFCKSTSKWKYWMTQKM